jgi:hypothetical protein
MKYIKTFEELRPKQQGFGGVVKSMFKDAFGKKKEVKQKASWAPKSKAEEEELAKAEAESKDKESKQ